MRPGKVEEAAARADALYERSFKYQTNAGKLLRLVSSWTYTALEGSLMREYAAAECGGSACDRMALCDRRIRLPRCTSARASLYVPRRDRLTLTRGPSSS